MAQPSGRQPFRFRIPWITTAPPPPTISRPPFRPPGVAPPPSLPRPSPQPRTESRPPSPARTTPQPPSPAKRAPSQPPSPARTAPQSRVISLPSSPQPPTAPQTPPRTDIRPPSPSLTTPKSPPSPSPAPSESQQPPPIDSITSPQPSPPHMASQQKATTSEALTQPRSQPRSRPSPSPAPSKPQESPLATITSPQPPSPPRMALTQPQSPPRSSVSPTTAMTHLPESSPDKNYQQEQKTVAREEKKVSSIIPIEEEIKQNTSPELPHMASASNEQSEEEERHQNKQPHVHERDVLAKVAAGKEIKPAVPIEDHSSGPQHSILHKEIRDDISRFTRKLSANPDENPVSVITLAGENTGATMRLETESSKRERSVRIYRGYKLNQDETSEATTTDGETSTKRTLKDPKTGEDASSTAYINSNAQTVNNSIMSNSSINVKSPGVHVVFAQSPSEAVKPTGTVEARKAENNVTQPQKLTYEPNVRRRCLRGLMLESSDSDPGNPDKPRRHGCRVNCREKLKGRENGNDF